MCDKCMYECVHVFVCACVCVHEYVYILQSTCGNESAVLGVGPHFPPSLKQGLYCLPPCISEILLVCLLLTIGALGLQMSANTPNGGVNSGPHGWATTLYPQVIFPAS